MAVIGHEPYINTDPAIIENLIALADLTGCRWYASEEERAIYAQFLKDKEEAELEKFLVAAWEDPCDPSYLEDRDCGDI